MGAGLGSWVAGEMVIDKGRPLITFPDREVFPLVREVLAILTKMMLTQAVLGCRNPGSPGITSSRGADITNLWGQEMDFHIAWALE